jgi:RNA 2',3'-cyclic 3'-phosphodiesterase
MSNTIRCFLALKIPADTALRRVLKELAAMGRALKAVESENLHVTLKFFAAAEPESIPEIAAIATAAAAKHAQSQLTLTGLGAFPNAERPNVIWAGLAGPGAQTLCTVAGELEESLETIGFERENRPFAPHLTLARVKFRPPEELRALLVRHSKTVFGTSAVKEIVLIRSEPGLEGSRYTVLEHFPLGANTN